MVIVLIKKMIAHLRPDRRELFTGCVTLVTGGCGTGRMLHLARRSMVTKMTTTKTTPTTAN
jgi:hypothetical protein